MSTKKDAATKNCFVIAPIDKAGTPTRQRSDDLFKHVIEPVTRDMGYSSSRADHISEPGLITRQVVERVIESDLVIADLSEHNPNVFYELSLRHAIVKPVVHLIQEGEKLPFDVQDFRTVIYNTAQWGSLDETKRELREYIEATEHPGYKPVSPISVAVDLAAALSGGTADGDVDLRVVLGTVLDQVDATQRAVTRLEAKFALSAGRAPVSSPDSDVARKLLEAFSRLEPNERKIIALAYGLEGNRPRSLGEIARETGMKIGAIAKTYERAMRELRSLVVHTDERWLPLRDTDDFA